MTFVEDHPTLILCVSVIVAYLVWNLVSNLYFHPLAGIPGPWLPALTPWYEVYFDCVHKGGGQYPFQIQKLHDKYGPIIRPVPDQVHINDPSFLDVIYASRNRNHIVNYGLNVDRSLGGAEDFKLHRLRREALNPCFSLKSVLDLQSLLTEKGRKVMSILNEAANTGNVVNMSDIYFGYANDVVRAFSFGSDHDLLSDLQEANNQRNNLARLLRTVHLQRHFPGFYRLMGQVMPKIRGSAALPPGVLDLIKFKKRIRQDIIAVLEDKDDTKKAQHTVFYELRDSSILPPEEKTVDRLQDEATLIVMAGTESTAKSLGIATFYLLQQPAVLHKLRAELADATQELNRTLMLSDLLALPYLNAVITESRRLSFGVTRRTSRYSPDETLLYTASYGPHKGTTYALPPKTKMATLTYCTHTNESLFPCPLRFDPERWIVSSKSSEAEVNYRKRCMHALGKGHRKCLGINLASAALCLVLAEIVNYKMTLVETDESDVEFQYDFQISHPRSDSEGIRVKVKDPDRA